MGQMYVIGEDALCCALGTRLVIDVVGWSLAQPAVNTNGVTKLKKDLARYVSLTRICPVLCVADTDGGCASKLREQWLPNPPGQFLLRLAVTESESWLMADHEALAAFLDVPESRFPDLPDEIDDAKRTILNLARRSKKRMIRQEVISSRDTNKPGNGYNLHLCDFVVRYWSPERAAQRSPSLARAMKRLTQLREQ